MNRSCFIDIQFRQIIWIITFFILITLTLNIVIFIFQGYYNGYLPSASEICVNHPMDFIAFGMISFTSVLILISLLFYQKWASCHNLFSKFFSSVYNVLSFALVISLILYFTIPLEQEIAHFLFKIIFLISFLSILLISIKSSWLLISKPMKYSRLILLIFIFITLLFSFFIIVKSQPLVGISIQNSFHYAFILLSLIYLVLWSDEFRELRVTLDFDAPNKVNYI